MVKRGAQPRHKLEMSRNPQEIFRERKAKTQSPGWWHQKLAQPSIY